MNWIWHLCFTNMKQRGTRTFLTVLGVVIGVISVVSLLAIGIGVKEELISNALSSGSITEITVYGLTEGKRKDKMLTDRKAAELEKLEYVTAVYPMSTCNVIMQYDRFIGYIQLMGVPESYLKGIEIGEGERPSEDTFKPELLMGNGVVDLFFNEGNGLNYTDMNKEDGEGKNLTGETVEVQFDMWEDTPGCRLEVSGMTKDMSYEVYCNIDVLKKYLKRITKEGGIPGQPVDENGNNDREWIYDRAVVLVDDVSHVDKMIEKLQNMGYQTENDKEFLDAVQKEMKVLQILLGGIGMVAMVVAVIGIGNTMTTSVYDRINEIGILKVLGCDTDDLLCLFLLESGILGGIGGLIGIIASYGITEMFINRLGVKLLELPKGTELAVIPLWLSVVAFFFAVILGVLAGFFPARWAAKQKPIEAMGK